MIHDLPQLVEILRSGGVVACPTETWVGLLADARNATAIEKVAALKDRPAALPIALLIHDVAALSTVSSQSLSGSARALAEQHWPGPLTILVHARNTLDSRLIQDGKVGVRIPGPSPAASLVEAFGGPLTATSANRSGEPPVRRASALPAKMRSALDGEVPGESPGGPPSTLVDASTTPIRILRAGAIEIPATAL